MTKSSGFTLIELLVVVAIIGILSSIGTLAYNGYLEGTRIKAAENVLVQIGLAQTDHYADCNSYYSSKKNYCQPSTAEDECTPDKTSTNKLSTELFNKPGYIDTNNQFNFCSFIKDDGTFEAVALGPGNCKLRVDASGGKVDKTGCN